MNKLYKYLFASALFAVGLSQASCSKEFLEIEPKGYLTAKETKDYEQILNATYLASIFTASSILGDEVAVQGTYFDAAELRTQRLFKFEDRVYQPDELPLEINAGESYIRRLYLFNKIINEVMASQQGTDEQKRAIQAEAKVGRAICNLMFLNDFSAPYNAATAASDPGIPIITEADVTTTKFVRASIKDVYEFMIKDLKEALPYLGPLVHRRKFSKAAAAFYLGRIYLYMGNFAEAKTHVDGAFAELDKANIPLALYDYNIVLDENTPETWFPDISGLILANKPLAAVNSQVIYNIEIGSFFINSVNTFVFSPQTATLFDPADKRLALYAGVELFGTFVYPKGMRRYSAGFFQDVGPSLPDLYLMRAELKARTNDLGGAKADVEALRAKRMSANVSVPSNIASDQEALVRFILEERIREFALSGMRWLDMRRLSVDPVYKTTVKYTHDVYDDNGNLINTYTLKPERFALKFGERMLAENQGLTENP